MAGRPKRRARLAAQKEAGENSDKSRTRARKAHVSLTPARQLLFLKTLAESSNVTAAAEAAGVSRDQCYALKAEDEGFRKAWEDALEQAVDNLEGEAYRRAKEGTEEPVVSAGKLVTTVRKYSDTLMVTLLRAHRPERYRERISAEHTGKDGAPLQITAVSVFAQMIERLADRMQPKVIEAVPIPKKADESQE